MAGIFKSSKKTSNSYCDTQQKTLCIATPIFWWPSIALTFILWSRALQYFYCKVHHTLFEYCV